MERAGAPVRDPFMSGSLVLPFVAAAVYLALALLAGTRGRRNAMAAQLGLMCSLLFVYNVLDATEVLTGNVEWDWLAYAAAALLAIPTLNLVTTFVGAHRRTLWPRRVFAAYFVFLAAATLAGFAWPALAWFPASDAWATAMLLGLAPGFGGAAVLLMRHERRSSGQERARCRLLGGAIVLGVGGSMIDLVLIAAGIGLRLAALPLLVAAGLIAALVLKARILENATTLALVNAAVTATVAVIGQLAVFVWAGTRPALLVLGSTFVVVATLAALRPLWRTLVEQRDRMRYLATLGRIADQMAHDIRNPVAAIRGAAQLLQGEHESGGALEDHLEFLDIIVERSDHLERVVRRYQSMGRVEPTMDRVRMNALVERIVDGQRAAHTDIDARLDLEKGLPDVRGDADLLAVALENVLRNAYDAMPDGGEVSVRTSRATLRSTAAVRISVRDTGHGIDHRTQEHVFEDFFTTKAQGSGLGLPYLRRVVEAHGGAVSLQSEPEEGTTVDMVVPAAKTARPRDE